MCKFAQWVAIMNWDDLKIFLAVARTGTFSGAAKQLNVQHSTISRRVKALEKDLGSNLVRRKRGRYELTKAGSRLEHAALKVESEVIQVDGALLNRSEPLTGRLRVTTINTMASTILMPVFAEFQKLHPEIDLHILSTNEPVSLTNRDADIALRWTNQPNEFLVGKKVTNVASTIYASKDYLRQLQQSNQAPEWIGVTCCDFHRDWTRESTNQKQFKFNSDDAAITHRAIQEGLGVSYLPCFIGDSDPLLERLCPPNPKFDLGFWVIIHPEQKFNARVTTFRNYIISTIEQMTDIFDGRQYS